MTLVKKTDVEEYIGGADADVEAILKSFQDALAYVLFLFLFQFEKKKIYIFMGRIASTAIWTQV